MSDKGFGDFEDYYADAKLDVDAHIDQILEDHQEEAEMRKLLSHATEGGKRVRPVVTLLVADAVGCPKDRALDHAAIVELLHTACVTGDTRVRMADGTVRKITDVGEGDEILAFNEGEGRFVPREVTHFHENGVQNVLTVEMGNREVTCTPDHEFLVYQKEQQVRWRATEVVSEAVDNASAVARQADTDAPDGTVRNWVNAPGTEWGQNCCLPGSDARKVLGSIGIDAAVEEVCEPKQMKFQTPDVSFEYVEASDLSEGDVVVAAKETKQRTTPSADITPPGDLSMHDYARLAGIIVGDGTVSEYHMKVCTPEPDPVRPWVVGKLAEASANSITEMPESVEVADVAFNRTLREHGLATNHTDIEVPDWVWASSAEVQRQFVAGLIDADGTVTKDGMVDIGLANYALVRDTKALLDQLGFTTSNIWSREVSTSHIDGSPTTTTRLYHLKVGPHQVADGLTPLSPEYRERLDGFERTRSMRLENEVVFPDGGEPDFDEVGFTRVRSVEAVEEPQETYDLRVEGDHNYVADGVVTHNSLVADDRFDNDEMRRGRPAVWKVVEKLPFGRSGEKFVTGMTVMANNGLFALSLELVKHPGVTRAMGEGIKKVFDGFYKEAKTTFTGFLADGYDKYISINRLKTGGLFAISSQMSVVVAGGGEEAEEAARKYGETMGILYQVADDYCDDDLPPFIDDPEAELEKWYDECVSYLSGFPNGDVSDYLHDAPAWVVWKMLTQEGKTDIDPEFFDPAYRHPSV